MLEPFILRAALAGLALVCATGPLGCFVLWGRMAYFGDAMGHAAMLGVALALAAGWPVPAGTILVAVTLALLIVRLSGRTYSSDTILGVLAHGSLAAGLVAASLVPTLRLNLEAFLFGDILSVTNREVWLTAGIAAAVLIVIVSRWQKILTAIMHEEMAAASGIRPAFERLVLTVALAVIVAASIRLVGTLLIAALLVIPAAAARAFSRTPEEMAIWASLFGGLSILGGLGVSLTIDTPAGPSIVLTTLVFFMISQIWPRWFARRR